jgi:tetratricopeptide (TPR) repeat protein/predicted Ser/Thr protein kinase
MKCDHFEFDPRKDRIGEGPQSEVYKALDTNLGRTVALKILRSHVEFDPEAVERFKREAKHTSSLEHPNIATIYEFGERDEISYIAMEFLEGQTLDKILRERNLGYEEGLRIAEQVAAALAHVHTNHLIHRDLKPANIMVQGDGRVKLLDFGICRSNQETRITQHDTMVGTVLYMSPEQLRLHDLDFSSDVFAFGSVFYHALTGALPFPGRAFAEVCMAILDGRPKRPSEQRQGFPAPLEAFLLRCLAPQKEDRFLNGMALHAELQGLVEGMSGAVAAVETPLKGRLAVAPFSAEPEDEQGRAFAAGLRRDLVAELERSSELELVPQKQDTRPAASSVDWWLRGRLHVEGHTGTVAVEMIRLLGGRTEVEPWAHEVRHEDPDEWGLQAQLVSSLARAIRRHLREEALRPAPAVRRDSGKAESLLQAAHQVMHRGRAKHLLAAIVRFESAISADPGLAKAHAGLAEALVRKFLYWDGDRSFIEQAQECARRALLIDPRCAEAHTSLGFAYSMTGQREDALREYRLAIQLDNQEWLAHRLMGALEARLGNFKAAAPLLRKAINLRPAAIASYDHLFNVLQRLNRHEESLEIGDLGIAAARSELAQVEDNQEARLHMGLLLARMSGAEEARRVCQKAREVAPRDGYTLFHSACILSLIGDREQAVEALSEAQARGYYVQSELWSNTDLDSLRELPRFRELAG